MRKPVIGVSCNYDYGDVFQSRSDMADIHPKWHTVCENYTRAIEEAGGIPLLLPVYQDKADLACILGTIDGLLLTGGGDVDPLLYGEPDRGKCGRIMPQRDAQDIAMAQFFVSRTVKKPMLCICRGIQVLNVALGGTLYQDLESAGFSPHSKGNYPMNAVSHSVSIAPDSRLFRILGTTALGVNSFHHQSIRDPGSGLQVTATSEDGVIEAVELEGKSFVLGVQWHPEKMYDSEEQKKIFAAFIRSAKNEMSNARKPI